MEHTKGCQVSGIPNHVYYLLELKNMHLRVVSSVKPLLLMYYHKGILKKSLNRSWKEVKVSYKSTFVTLLQAKKWVSLLLTGRMQKSYSKKLLKAASSFSCNSYENHIKWILVKSRKPIRIYESIWATVAATSSQSLSQWNQLT